MPSRNPIWRKVSHSFRALLRRKRLENELDAELGFDTERRVEAKVRAGMNEKEARIATMKEFGALELAKEECRDERGTRWLEDLWQDIRFGLRMLRKSPGFTAIAVLTLALGIGANTAMFSVVNSVLLRPLPYPRPYQLVQLEMKAQRGGLIDSLTVPQFQFLRDHSSAFQSIAGFRGGSDISLKQGNTVDWVTSAEVTDDFFRVLGSSPAMGREFARDETRPGGAATAILSDELWRKSFGADAGVVGRQITLDDRSYTVVGVMPGGFKFVEGAVDVFVPLQLGNTMSDRGANTEVLARLNKGETIGEAQANVAVVYDQFHRQDTAKGADAGVQLVGYQDSLVNDVKPSLLALFGAVGLLLLVACANVASLLLARSNARQKEVSIRLALGARRGRLLRQFLTESLLMALFGGSAGLLVATWLLKTLVASIPFILPTGVSVSLDGSVLTFTFLTAIGTSVVFGLASFWQTSKLDLNSSLKESSKGSAGISRNRTGKTLVIVEVALSVTMLIGAGLLIGSLYRLRHQDLGFDPENVITMTTPFTPAKNTPLAAVWNSQQQIMNRIKALPGVVSVAAVNVPPLVGRGNMPAQREGHNEDSIGGMEIREISEEFFKTLRIPILQGRGFSEGDTESSAPVVVINQTVARKWWNGANPIGDHIIVGMYDGKQYVNNALPLEVVGVVADVKGMTIKADAPPTVYLPTLQRMSDGNPPRAWVIRTEREANISGELRAIVTDVNPTQRVMLLLPMQQVIGTSVATPNFDALLMGLFAGLALALTAVGIYGVLSFTVAQRTHEIGIRMALGARRVDVLRLVAGQGMVLAWTGIGIGILAAMGLTRFLETLLFNVQPIDAPTYAAVAVALTGVALLASYIPARRAMRVDPVTALRNE